MCKIYIKMKSKVIIDEYASGTDNVSAYFIDKKN